MTWPVKAPISQSSALTDGTKIVGVVPAKTHRVVRSNNDGRSTISDNWQTQREIHTTRLLEADMLAQEHALGNHMSNVSGAGNNFCSAETRPLWTIFPVMPKAHAHKSLKKIIKGIREYPCDEMRSGDVKRRRFNSIRSSTRDKKSPVAMEN